jgi:hypothetical protein
MRIKQSDWVTIEGFTVVGCVKRVARDGSWADVNWHTHTKRMQTSVLTVQTTISICDGWTVTDETRSKELAQAEQPA